MFVSTHTRSFHVCKNERTEVKIKLNYLNFCTIHKMSPYSLFAAHRTRCEKTGRLRTTPLEEKQNVNTLTHTIFIYIYIELTCTLIIVSFKQRTLPLHVHCLRRKTYTFIEFTNVLLL